MPEEEKLALENKLKSDSEFKDKFEQYTALVSAIKTSAREAFKKKIAKEESDTPDLFEENNGEEE